MSEPMERGPNYDWKHEAEHYRAECDKLRDLLGKVEASGERDAFALEAAQAERDRYRRQSENYSLELLETQQERDQLRAENAALKEKLALAVETLEKYRKARFSHGDSMKMADDCLKRISGEAGGSWD